MGILGIVLLLSGATVSWAAEATARGKIGVNALVGLRVGYVTHSAEAWLAGHRAARPLLHASGATFALGGILVLAWPGITDEGGGVVSLGACLVALGLVIAAAVKANRAAERAVVRSVTGQNRS